MLIIDSARLKLRLSVTWKGLNFLLQRHSKRLISIPFFRLKIAEQHQDIAAQRRAFTNLGNASVFLANYEDSIQFYKKGEIFKNYLYCYCTRNKVIP